MGGDPLNRAKPRRPYFRQVAWIIDTPNQQTPGAAFFAFFSRKVRIPPLPRAKTCPESGRWPTQSRGRGQRLHRVAAAPLRTTVGAASHCFSICADFDPLIQAKSRQTPKDSTQLLPFLAALDRNKAVPSRRPAILLSGKAAAGYYVRISTNRNRFPVALSFDVFQNKNKKR